MNSEFEINICNHICALTDELRDQWLKGQSSARQKKLMSLTVSQQRLLRAVWRMTRWEPEGVSLRKLAEKLTLSSSAVSVMVETMVQTGFLQRINAVDDRRKVLIKLSKLGEERRAFCEAHAGEIAHDFFVSYDNEKLRVFEEVLFDFTKYLLQKKEK